MGYLALHRSEEIIQHVKRLMPMLVAIPPELRFVAFHDIVIPRAPRSYGRSDQLMALVRAGIFLAKRVPGLMQPQLQIVDIFSARSPAPAT